MFRIMQALERDKVTTAPRSSSEGEVFLYLCYPVAQITHTLNSPLLREEN